MFTYPGTCDGPRHFGPEEGFGSPCANSGLTALGSVAHRALCDRSVEFAWLSTAEPAAARLHGVLGKQLAPAHACHVGHSHHQQPDQIVGPQTRLQLVLHNCRRQAAHHLSAQGGLDAADAQL